MMRRWVPAAFLVVCVAQLAVPALMIRTYEATLANGRAIKVKCRPVDPADAFRGRYVRVTLQILAPPDFVPEAGIWMETRWASLEEGEDGFARAGAIYDKRPAGVEALRVRYAGQAFNQARNSPGEHFFRLDLDRYYMTEAKAAAAERANRENNARGSLGAYAVIRVLGGTAVIESLNVAGMPIEEYLALPPDERPRPPEAGPPSTTGPRARPVPGGTAGRSESTQP